MAIKLKLTKEGFDKLSDELKTFYFHKGGDEYGLILDENNDLVVQINALKKQVADAEAKLKEDNKATPNPNANNTANAEMLEAIKKMNARIEELAAKNNEPAKGSGEGNDPAGTKPAGTQSTGTDPKAMQDYLDAQQKLLKAENEAEKIRLENKKLADRYKDLEAVNKTYEKDKAKQLELSRYDSLVSQLDSAIATENIKMPSVVKESIANNLKTAFKFDKEGRPVSFDAAGSVKLAADGQPLTPATFIADSVNKVKNELKLTNAGGIDGGEGTGTPNKDTNTSGFYEFISPYQKSKKAG